MVAMRSSACAPSGAGSGVTRIPFVSRSLSHIDVTPRFAAMTGRAMDETAPPLSANTTSEVMGRLLGWLYRGISHSGYTASSASRRAVIIAFHSSLGRGLSSLST